MLHQFDGRGSNNYQRLPKHAHSLQLRGVTEHIGASSRVSCCLQQEPVRWHQSLHWMSQLDDAVQREENDLRVYRAQVLQAVEHPSQRSHLLVELGCGHEFVANLDYQDQFEVVLPTNGAVEHHPL